MSSQSYLRDFSKIGVFLIGIALIILASIVLHFYVTYLIRTLPLQTVSRPFNAYCTVDRAIIVNALQDIEDVVVLDNRSNTVCAFNKIKSGSEELCMAREYGVYIVQYNDFKDVVECPGPFTIEREPLPSKD